MRPYPILAVNPELQRSLWLELTFGRLVWMAVVLSLLIGGLYEIFGIETLPGLLRQIILALVMVWGARMAGETITDEIADKTWDVQRLSTQNATALVMGKLIGGTSYVWYGAILCIVVIASVFPDKLVEVPDLLLAGMLAQTTALFSALVFSRFGMRSHRVSNLTAQVLGVLTAYIFNTTAYLTLKRSGLNEYADDHWRRAVSWYGHSLPVLPFAEIIAGLIAFWMLVGSIRLVRRELGHRNGPSGWTCFVIFMIVFTAGFTFTTDWVPQQYLAWQSNVFRTTSVLAYLALLGAPASSAALRRLGMRVAAHDWMFVWREMPAWVVNLLFVIGSGIVYALSGAGHILVTVSSLGFLLRNAIVVYGIRLHFTRRSETGILVFLLMAYVLLPLVANNGFTGMYGNPKRAIGMAAFLPMVPENDPWTVIMPWVESLLAGFCFYKDFVPRGAPGNQRLRSGIPRITGLKRVN